jgi:hypothetical protein
VSAAEVVYGKPLQLPGQAVTQDSDAITWQKPEHAEWIPLRPRTYAEVTHGPVNKLADASFVYVRRGPAAGPLAPLFDGPFRVLAKSEKVFCVQMGSREEVIIVDRLKAYEADGPPSEVAVPRRVAGRPGRAAVLCLLLRSRRLRGGHV